MLDADTCHAALDARDRRFDGRFYTGVLSTGIYCRCICPARTPKRVNRRFFASAAAAESASFRPCLICRPERAPGFAPIDAPARLAAQALARIEAGALEERGLSELAQELGVTDRHLRRVMRENFGASPIELAQTARLLAAKRLLTETALPITEIAFASGFKSLRRFNAAMKARYGFAPSRLRAKNAKASSNAITLTLAARDTYDPAPIFEFLSTRAQPGIEHVAPGAYTRTLQIGDAKGWIKLTPEAAGLTLQVAETLTPKLRPLITAVRAAFDLDADISAIDERLAMDARMSGSVVSDPRVRIAGGVEGFEIAVRAVLGQQITVRAAQNLVAKLCARFGEQASDAPDGLTLLFPSSARLAAASADEIASLGMPRARAETLHALASAHASGELLLAQGAIAAGREGLARIKGVGPWTIEYIALRALADPDAYPASDAALVAALGAKGETLAHLSPWRGYAAMRLWREVAQKAEAAKSKKGKAT